VEWSPCAPHPQTQATEGCGICALSGNSCRLHPLCMAATWPPFVWSMRTSTVSTAQARSRDPVRRCPTGAHHAPERAGWNQRRPHIPKTGWIGQPVTVNGFTATPYNVLAVNQVAQVRPPNLWNLDLRLAKNFKIGGGSVVLGRRGVQRPQRQYRPLSQPERQLDSVQPTGRDPRPAHSTSRCAVDVLTSETR
jgi:hypothetical protein